jgi:type II secretory pathway predicted ATPase ExeA
MDTQILLERYAPGELLGQSALRGFKLVCNPLPHRRYKEAMYAIAELHQRRRNYGEGGGLLVIGLSGAGKSTILKSYLDNFPREHEAARTRVKVLAASVPSSPTASGVGDAIINAFGPRRPHHGSAGNKLELLINLFEKCGVEKLLLDEFHHLLYAPNLNHFREVMDWLKLLFDKTKASVIGAGLPEAELVADSNPQFRRRFSKRVRLLPFELDNEKDFQEFRAILKAFGRCLPLPCATPLHEANLARRFHVGSYGLLDYVVKTLEGAVSAAATAGIELLDLPTFSAGFRNTVWHDVPDRLNPFHPESPLRPLDRPGEVFHQYTIPDVVGSPVARKLGMNLTRGDK